jgi:hypothetical protein
MKFECISIATVSIIVIGDSAVLRCADGEG